MRGKKLTDSLHPLPRVPIPHQPRVAPSHLRCSSSLPSGEVVPRIPSPAPPASGRPLFRIADVAPAGVDLHPLERPRVKDTGERLRLRRPSCLLQAIVAEVEPPTAPSHRRRPPAADVAGLVLLHREGDVVGGVDRRWRVTAGFSTLTAVTVIQRRENWFIFIIQVTIRDFLILNDSSTENTGTPAATATPIACALRSLILLYRYVHVQVHTPYRAASPESPSLRASSRLQQLL